MQTKETGRKIKAKRLSKGIVSWPELEEVIFSIAYELEHGVVFGILVESKVFWDSDLAHAMPIHWNID